MQKNNPRSLCMLVLAMAIFGSIGIFRRYIPLSSALLACFRGAAGALFLLAAAKLSGRSLGGHIGRKVLLGLVVTGAVMGFHWILLFEAYNFTTVPIATLCYYLAPTIIILASPFVFGETITPKKAVCVVLSLLGMVFVSGIVNHGVPQLSEMKGVLFGLSAAVLYAAVVIMNKKLPGIDAYEKTIIQLVAAALVLVPYLLVTGESVSGITWTPFVIAMLLIVGFVHTGVAYALYFGSMDGLRAQTVAIFSYIDPICALLLSALILHESLSVYGLIGAVLIIGAAVGSEMKA